MEKNYDIIIAGGGLAGLVAAIQLSQTFQVLVIDPDDYPRHKMCGEYLSLEVNPFLTSLGINLEELSQVNINRFSFSRGSKSIETTQLPLGGKGISRHLLDYELFKIASLKATFFKERVSDVNYINDIFQVVAGDTVYQAKQVLIATGKRSILDKKLDRSFIKKKSPWLAVKMHYDYDMSSDLVELHAFNGGYAGLSQVENGKVNLCYLANYDSFKKHKDIDVFNDEVLCKNDALKQFFATAIPAWEKPITISQISFEQKEPVEGKLIMIGDTAGLIHPLCGNGMAMAIHSAHIASQHVTQYLNKKITRDQMLINYSTEWKSTFKSRLRYGRWLQRILLKENYTNIAYTLLERLPYLLPIIIKKTHGQSIKP
ncbi:MAG: NAD(P)/FAD-dependent oxidoreductase [Nonlabens sp.]|uniref:NAD(P)/FAD-dependent oxidoreductase n=1 Tax=Nonlabens sp. TaxID=1888209 RepID=UPI003EF1F7CA